MTTTTAPRPPTAAAPPPPGRRSVGPALALIAALTAGGALLWSPPHRGSAPAARVTAATAWQHAQRADLPAGLADGSAFQPLTFLDARTSIGTAPSPDATDLRLILRHADGTIRQLRRLPVDDNPSFDHVAVAGDDLAWAETTDHGRFQLWTINLRNGTPARQLTADAGNALFFGSQYDLVIADGRVHWVAAPKTTGQTQIRSVPLTGGPVTTRTESGNWALTAWPWLVDGQADVTGATRLRSLTTNRDLAVANADLQTRICTPTWCRAVTATADGNAVIELAHPDGTDRHHIATGTSSPALADVAILDRFEALSTPTPDSDLTGTAQLAVHDLATGHTIDINPNVSNASTANGVLWYSTGIADSIVWHTIDLRSI